MKTEGNADRQYKRYIVNRLKSPNEKEKEKQKNESKYEPFINKRGNIYRN